MNICAVIVTYNAGDKLIECVNSIKQQIDELIIVDNGSSKDTIDILGLINLRYGIRIIYNGQNLGIAAALNTGVKHALDKGYEWILTLDHDSVASAGMVDTMLSGYEDFLQSNKDINIGIIAPQPYDINSGTYLVKGHNRIISSKLVNAVISSGSLINRKVINDIGNFDEKMFLYYVDNDYCMRARKAGYSILMVADAVLYHSEGNKSVKRLLGMNVDYYNYNPVANYYIFRNSIYILKKHGFFDPYMVYLIARRIPADLLLIILYSSHKIADIKYTLLGLFHGLTGRSGKLNISS